MGRNAAYNLKLKMQAGGKVFGPLVGSGGDPEKTVKALKELESDFIFLDLEHCLMNKETILEYIRVASRMNIPLLIRPEDKSAHFRCYLDAGVNGVILPLLDTVEEAAHAINMSYFPPIGHRGCGIPLSPHVVDFQNLAEVPLQTLVDYVNNNTLLFVQTETVQNLYNLRHILSLEGVTGTIVGTLDLAVDIGGFSPKAPIAEVLLSEVIHDKLGQVLKVCKETKKVAGVGSPSPEDLVRWAKEGYQLLIVGSVLDGNVDLLRPYLEQVRSLIG